MKLRHHRPYVMDDCPWELIKFYLQKHVANKIWLTIHSLPTSLINLPLVKGKILFLF
jgi:hypothetical protein